MTIAELMRKLFITSIFFLFCISIVSAKGIKFHNDILEEALQMAKKEGKYVFIDTYAPWCAPCKRMNKVFLDPQVGDLFNDRFINVKINMDGSLGKQMLMKYDVVWLPTLLILDGDGNIKYKIDKEVKAEGLLEMAHNALDPNFTFYNAPSYSSSPITSVSSKPKLPKTNPKPPVKKEPEVELGVKDVPHNPEKILYVYDENAKRVPPKMLYHEAYLHMQLLSPKTQWAADRYLKTQDDWTTEKNIKFIFDFTESVHSEYFDFFVENLSLFKEKVGAEKVMKNLQIMIYMRLNNGFPRPDLKESIALYEILDSDKGQEKAYQYYLQRLKNDGDFKGFVTLADRYLYELNPGNVRILQESTEAKIKNNLKGLPKSLKLINKVLEQRPNDITFTVLKCKVLKTLGKKNDAMILAKKTLKALDQNDVNSSELESFLSENS